MSAVSNGSKETITTSVYQPVPSAIAARRRRSILVNSLRVLFLVVIIGGWELTTRVGIVDKFFWGQPSGIWAQLVKWVTQGTAQGPLWLQIAVTLEETILGFVIGVVLGIVFGVVLGNNRFLADILAPFIKALTSILRAFLGRLSI